MLGPFCWKHSAEILVHGEVMAAHPWCESAVQETSLRWFDVCGMVHYGMDVNDSTPLGCAV